MLAEEQTARSPRFAKNGNGTAELDEASSSRARRLVGVEGYVANIPVELMSARR